VSGRGAAVFRAMLLGFARDRGALVMSFLLPVAFFLVFALIFASAAGNELRPRLALCDEVRSPTSRRLVDALRGEPALRFAPEARAPLDAAGVRELVRAGTADVGLIVRRNAEPLGTMGGAGAAPLALVVDPAKSAAAQLVAGLVQRVYFQALPDVALGGVARFLDDQYLELSGEQKRRLDEGLQELRADAGAGRTGGAAEELFERESVVGPATARNHVAYYAGAVAILFLFFSAVHGALTLLDERDAGVLERLLAGPGGLAPLVDGKFLFLVAQGCVQVSVIFVVAWLVHGVELPARLGGFALITLGASMAAAGLALALTAACSTKAQAQTLANVAILILSALGGSMVPRFFMPPVVQALGWATPNTWAIEAYTSLFWRGEPLAALAVPLALLATAGLAGLALARRLVARWQEL
jgi:ABC-2 type transport system permease protein